MKKRLISTILALTLLLGSIAVLASCDDSEKETESETIEITETETDGTTVDESDSDTQTVIEDTETEEPTDAETETETEKDTETESQTEPEATTEVSDVVYENGEVIKNAGTQWDDEVFALTENTIDESKAITKTAAEILVLLQDKDALAEGEVYRVTEPLVLSSNTKYYGNLAAIIAEGGIVIKDVSEVVIKEIILKGNITVENSTGITLFKLDIKGGDVGISLDDKSSDIALKNCKVYANDIAIKSDAELVSVYRNYLSAKNGLVSTGNDLAIQDSHIVAVDLGVSSLGQYCTVKGNSIEVSTDGIGVDFKTGSYNGLIALNIIKDAQVSVKVVDGYNCVVLLNSAIRIIGENTTNLYVVENKLGGNIELNNNEYLLCDGNTFINDGKEHSVANNGNTEFNGDNLLDVNARPQYGANEEILPHTNKDLFVGMERQGKVRDVSLTKSYTFNNYMRTMGRKNSVVIVPPGVYTTSDELFIDGSHSNTTFYAYGVYDEKDILFPILNISSTSNVTVKGLTLGYVHQSSGQVYVLEKLADQKLRVITNAGYVNDFGQSDLDVFNSGMCDAFFEDSLVPWQSSISYRFIEKNDDGTMILQYTGSAKEFATIGLGDVFACRLAGDNSRSIYLAGQNVKLKDCVLYGYSAALAIVSGGSGNSNVEIERLHNTVHSGYLIDEETYNRYKELEETYGVDLEVYIDELGRYRGGLPRVGSVDATHISGANVGVNATSCLFESMCDDGSNQRGSSSRLAGYHDNGDGTTTLYYKGTLSQTYYGINTGKGLTSATPTNTNNFLTGDKILVYASDGHIAFEGTALTDATPVSSMPLYHSVHIDEDKNCVCDDDTCKALLHYDIGTSTAPLKNGYCDVCNAKVYLDISSSKRGGNNKCDITETELLDADGDGLNDADGVPIITSMTVAEYFNSATGALTYKIYYTLSGQKYIITYNTAIYEVKVKTELVDFEAFEGYDFTDNNYYMDQKVIIDNLSRNSAGFVFDNVLVRYTRSRGILVKTVDATIKNCTFRDHGMTAVLLSVETTWGESTVPQNITIQSCLFDNTGCLWGNENNLTQAPIAIQGLGNLSGSVEISEETLPCKNIKIIGNKFMNIQNNYCITMSAAQDITIKDNVFVKRDTDSEKTKYGKAIYINGCANINISGNTYSEIANGDITKAVVGYNYKGLTGSDVVDSEGNRLLPEEKEPMS